MNSDHHNSDGHPAQMMSLDSIAGFYTDECREEGLWSGDNEDEQEVWSTPSKKATDEVEESEEKYVKVMETLEDLKLGLMETPVVCQSNAVSLGDDMGTPHVVSSIGDGVLPSKQSTNILDPEGLQRKGRPLSKRMISVVDKAVAKKKQTKKKELSKEVREIANGNHNGTQESIMNANVNAQSSYMGHLMWPNMIPHTIPSNMEQGGNMIPFSPNFGSSLNQDVPFFTSSQTLYGGQFWRGGQIWGGQSSILGGPHSSNLQSGGQQSYMDMMTTPDGHEE